MARRSLLGGRLTRATNGSLTRRFARLFHTAGCAQRGTDGRCCRSLRAEAVIQCRVPCTLYVFTTIAESRLPCNRGGAELWRAQTPFSNAGSVSVVLPHEYCRPQGVTSVIPPSSLPLSRGVRARAGPSHMPLRGFCFCGREIDFLGEACGVQSLRSKHCAANCSSWGRRDRSRGRCRGRR